MGYYLVLPDLGGKIRKKSKEGSVAFWLVLINAILDYECFSKGAQNLHSGGAKYRICQGRGNVVTCLPLNF